MLGIEIVHAPLEPLTLLGMQHDIGHLALIAAAGLVQHDRGIGQADARARFARHQQERAGRHGHAHAERAHRRLDELHRVIHGHGRGHDAAGRVDIEVDFLLGIFRLEEQQLRTDEARHIVLHLAIDEDDPLPQQAGIDIEAPFSPRGLFHDHRDELHHVAHRRFSCL